MRALLLALVASLFAASALLFTTADASPPGPRLATVELIETKGSESPEPTASPFMALTTFGLEGGKQRHLLKQRLDAKRALVPSPFSGPTWSGGGDLLAVSASRGHTGGVYLTNADGRHPRLVPAARRGNEPVLGPDGTTLAFSRLRLREPRLNMKKFKLHGRYYASTTTWIAGLVGGPARRLTPWRNGLDYVPEAFSADGSLLVITKRDDRLDGPRIVLLHLESGEMTEFAVPAEEAAISPDGTRLAFVGYLHPTLVEAEEDHDYTIGELYTMNLDGTGIERLTRNEDKIESSPAWDPSGERLAWVEVVADTSFVPGLSLLFPTGNTIRQMNADGSCRETVASNPRVAFYGIAWQPGPERGAGRIECRP